jgi:hypothetical protein
MGAEQVNKLLIFFSWDYFVKTPNFVCYTKFNQILNSSYNIRPEAIKAIGWKDVTFVILHQARVSYVIIAPI